jgi:hypothetical protein
MATPGRRSANPRTSDIMPYQGLGACLGGLGRWPAKFFLFLRTSTWVASEGLSFDAALV